MVQTVSSAKGVLALLRESDNAVLLFALKRLLALMDTFWCDIASDIPLIEELHESASLTEETRNLAALVASQVYFHLGVLDDSVHFALAAGSAFDGSKRSLFTDTILSRCIDQYVEYQEHHQRAADAALLSQGSHAAAAGGNEEGGSSSTAAAAAAASAAGQTQLDPRLETLFVSLTNSWVLEHEGPSEVKEIVGFTIRARRLDFLERVLTQSLAKTRSADVLNFTFHVAKVLLRDISFRRKVLRLLADLYTKALTTVDYFAMAQCLLFLGDVPSTASLIKSLVKGGDTILAYQLAFDLFEYGNQSFLSALVQELAPDANAVMGTVVGGDPTAAEDASKPGPGADSSVEARLVSVLSGEVTTQLHVKFLYSRCVADIHVLNQIKKEIDPRKSVVHIATVMANAFVYCGTTIDAFLRDNMTWMGKANYWAKFITTASLGVIHCGHTDEALQVLETWLPKDDSIPSLPYAEAGALYALGLIHAPLGTSSDRRVIDLLAEKLRKFSGNVQLIHGASLGLGLAAMGLKDEELYDALLTCAAGSDAVDGEGASLAMGLLMMGSGNAVAVENLKNMACEETQKEKIIRGAVMAIALINLGRENEAMGLACELLESSEPWVRLGGCYVIGLAYAGTENSVAIEKLLQVTVRDTSDDVRRNAAMMIGLLCFTDPALCLDLTRGLVDSYNSHVRYGVAMALGVCAAGTGRADVINVLWEMKGDLVDLVRQGVYIALALVMVQLTEVENPKVKEFRQLIDQKVGDRKEDVCTKFGCIVAAGLLDAGGRNCTFALHRERHRLDKAVVGMFLFTQYWYWYPYMLMVSLAMTPTCFIGLNDKLQMPEYVFRSNAKPSTYTVPKSVLQQKKEVKATGVQAVVLSTTRKEEELLRKRGKPGAAATAAAAAAPDAPDAAKEKKEPEEPEPSFELMHNPCRVTAHQFAVITHTEDARYVPVKPNAVGVCLLRDTKPELKDEQLVKAIDIHGDQEALPPAPFAYP